MTNPYNGNEITEQVVRLNLTWRDALNIVWKLTVCALIIPVALAAAIMAIGVLVASM